jgi:CheY-like chemotaxis protein
MSRPILVIDDDAMVRMALGAVLRAAGFEVAFAEDGRKGMKLLRTLEPRLVITDIIMPEQEGIETIMAMRAARPDLKIIAISGGARIGHANVLDMASALGADEVLAKPFDPETLLTKVRKQLEAA